MERDNGEDVINDSANYQDSEDDTSFVTKVRTRVSGLFNSSISRLFGSQEKRPSTVRRRDDDDNLESQPPCKKVKGLDNCSTSFNNYYHDNHFTNNIPAANTSSKSTIFTNFAEPVAGTSGVRTQKTFYKTFTSSTLTNTEITNGDKDSDSGESTSGYSSMAKICNRDVLSHIVEPNTVSSLSKPSLNKSTETSESIRTRKLFNNSTPETPNRSLFTDQSLSPQAKNTSLSSRRPSFNTSNFGSPNFVDRTITTSRIINSPFYNGPTIYGGASAYGRHLGANESRRQQLKNSFLVKPVNKQTENNSCTSLSKTARRILDTLEQYSTSISDAKKIPLPTKAEKQGLLSKYVGANPYHMRESRVSSNKELMVPTVSELLKMKQKQRLQETTNKIRKIATSSTSSLNSEDYNIGENQLQQKHTNKMKAKISSVRPKATPSVEIIDNVVLKPVPLVIPENKLPRFDFVIPPPSVEDGNKNKIEETKTSVKSKSSLIGSHHDVGPSKVNENKTVDSTIVEEFTFSKPLVIADNLKSIVAINNFKFREPVSKRVCLSEKDNNKQISVPKPLDNKEMKTNVGGVSNTNVVAQNLFESLKNKQDPIMARFKPVEGSWECSTCLIRNKAAAVKCVACETARVKDPPKTQQQVYPSFGIQFNKKSDEWDCTSCFVRNKNQTDRCVACNAQKPSTNPPKVNGFGNEFKMSAKEWECKTCLVRNKKETTKCVACNAIQQDTSKSTVGFGDKFKPPTGTWECQTCLIRNKQDVDKCVACETKRAGTVTVNKFGAQFKPPSDTWECDTCLIRNKNELKNCAACQTPKEKISVPVKPSSAKWECPTCMVRNDDKMNKCPCCETPKPGVTLISKDTVNMFNFGVNKTQFSFGIPKDKVESNQSSGSVPVISVSSNFGQDVPKTSTTAVPTFSFGIKPENKGKMEKSDVPTPIVPVVPAPPKSEEKNVSTIAAFKFGSPSSTKTATPSAPSETAAIAGFQFKPSSSVQEPAKVPTFGSTAPVIFASGTKESPSNKSTTNSTPNAMFKFDSAKPLIPTVGLNNTAGGTKLQSAVPSSSIVKPGSEKPTKKSELFSFGASNAASSFSFVKTDNVPVPQPVAKPMFNFGSAAPAPGGFSFAPPNVTVPKAAADFGAKTAVPNPTAGFTFKPPASSDTSLFQAPPNASSGTATTKNGGFNFGSGSVTNNQAAVFSFGATQKPQGAALNLNQQSSSGGFNFSVPSAPAGGFKFAVPTPAFDANPKPSFNFTGGTIPSFSATPTEGGGPAPARKFKKAVRRAAQR